MPLTVFLLSQFDHSNAGAAVLQAGERIWRIIMGGGGSVGDTPPSSY